MFSFSFSFFLFLGCQLLVAQAGIKSGRQSSAHSTSFVTKREKRILMRFDSKQNDDQNGK